MARNSARSRQTNTDEEGQRRDTESVERTDASTETASEQSRPSLGTTDGVNRHPSTGRRIDTVSEQPDTGRTVARSTGGRSSQSSGSRFVAYNTGPDRQVLTERYGIEFDRDGAAQKLQRLEAEFGRERVSGWADEGMPVETMGKPRSMQAFRERTDSSGRPREASSDSGGSIQPKLEVSSPEDPAEKEAESVAEAVVSMDEPVAEETARSPERGRVSDARDTGGGTAPKSRENQVRSSVSGGPAPPAETRSYHESRTGRESSDAGVSTGPGVDEAARSVNAEAFTVGTDIVFANGAYTPNSQKQLANGSTHVAQQGGANRVDRQESEGQDPADGAVELLEESSEWADIGTGVIESAAEWAVDTMNLTATGAAQWIAGLFEKPPWSEAQAAEFLGSLPDSSALQEYVETFGSYVESLGQIATVVKIGNLLKGGEIQDALVEGLSQFVEAPYSGLIEGTHKLLETIFGSVPYLGRFIETLKILKPGDLTKSLLQSAISVVRLLGGAYGWTNDRPQRILSKLRGELQENLGPITRFFDVLQPARLAAAGVDAVVTMIRATVRHRLEERDIAELFRRFQQGYGLKRTVESLKKNGPEWLRRPIEKGQTGPRDSKNRKGKQGRGGKGKKTR